MPEYVVLFEASKDIAAATNKEKKEAKEIIETEAPTYIDKNLQPRTLVKRDLVRLDLQGQFNREGVRYANLQIQQNKPRMVAAEGEAAEGEAAEVEMEADEFGVKSTTIAIVLMPSGVEIPEAKSKEAFNGSLDKKEKAVIVEKK